MDKIDGIKIARISGDFVSDSTHSICNAIEKVIKESQTKAILLDFEKVEKIDTTAFACMISLIKEHMKTSCKIGVINLKNEGKDLARILSLSEIIKDFEDEKSAMAFMEKCR